MSNEYENVLTIFKDYKIPLSKEWLECCIEWCKDGNLPPNYTLKDLQMLVYQQWLFLDLKETEVESLPKNLSKEKKFILKGDYSLQMVQAVDISKPKHWQLQRIRNNLGKNAEIENDFGKRVLQLTLTDGVQDVEAMEFKPIPALSLNLAPGVKIRIMGPVMVRNGRIMLENKHVKVLGGCVEENRVKYAAENVLARALNLEENPNPQNIDEQILEIQETPTQQSYHSQFQTQQRKQADINKKLTENNATLNRKNNISKNQSRPPEINNKLLHELESDFDKPSTRSIKVSLLNNTRSSRTILESDWSNSRSQKRKQECKSPDLFEEEMEIDDDILNNHLDHIEDKLPSVNHSRNVTSNRNGYSSTVTSNTADIIVLDDDDDDDDDDNDRCTDDTFDDIDIDSHLDRIEEEMNRMPCSTQISKSPVLKRPRTNLVALSQNNQNTSNPPKKMIQSTLKLNSNIYDVTPLTKNQSRDQDEPRLKADFDNQLSGSSLKENYDINVGHTSTSFQTLNILTIEKLKTIQPHTTHGKFKINAKFKGVIEKLTTKGCTYNVIIEVEDESGDLPVKVHSNVIEGFVGVSPTKIEQLKDLVYQNDERAKAQIFECLKKIHSKIIILNNVVEIEIIRGEKYPVLVKIVL